MRDDTSIFPKLISLQQCLCEEIEANLDPVCFCGIIPGALTINDYGQEGQAYVRLVTVYPSDTLPVQTQRLQNCKTGLAHQIEVGIIRCAPLGPETDEGRHPPSLAQDFDAVRQQLADMAGIRRAILCCFDADDIVLGNYLPVGPEGMTLGGAWTVWV